MLRTLLPHLVAVLVLTACLRLAGWQLDRAEEKDLLVAQWAEAPALALSDLGESPPPFALVAGSGRFDTERHILLDNQLLNNHPGVHVFSLFSVEEGELRILVNRGWQPWLRRTGEWPRFETPEGPIELSGRLSPPPRVGFQLGEAEDLDSESWPNLMTYFDLDKIRAVLGADLHDQIVLLEPEHPLHLSSEPWRTVIMGPERHRAYAFQWYSIALAVFLIWCFLGYRQIKRR
ncbi:MAG: SURF1 family protein [Wenzhouxiangella sp.]|nr:SURF1 family protein [Wenzhouxiangella sp.]TVR95165.1 MAG: SURF1 family protein [Wenzhouxiangellaceae bacterium]